MDYKPYRQAIFQRVCQHCVELGSNGKCTLPEELKCGVERYLPEIIKTIQAVKSSKIQDYVVRLRERICANCSNQKGDGSCQLRASAECGLDRYFEIIVEAVEEVDGRKSKF